MADYWPEFDESPPKKVAASWERVLGDWITRNWAYIEFAALAVFFELLMWRLLIPGTIAMAAGVAWSLGRQSRDMNHGEG